MTLEARAGPWTAEAFDAWAERPENADKILELIAGEVVEVPSNPYASSISARISGYLFLYLMNHPIAHLTGEAGGFMVFGDRYAPDVAVVLKSRQAELAQQGYNPVAPDLAVEVDFPSTLESQHDLRRKIGSYLAAGTLLWIVDPQARVVEVYAPGEPTRTVDSTGTLDTLRGVEVLPGFRLAVKDIFPPETPPSAPDPA
jgi:Uma2 family endonuclease